ncbi:MAG: succinate dehydrogenase, hydrophobic membrane anchor protein [Burkholderiales bacterium]|jgi:succinate dehydrogenase / fumarate reductase membrane anchor subunit|nr:succinate dehydrogenase, hydrophobic membrane anchor protein [Burkholderiales bacterium]
MAETDRSSLTTPLKRVRGLGAAGSGTDHFWRQRITALAQIPLTLAFVVVLLSIIGKGHAEVVAIVSQPLVAILMLLFVVTGMVHMKIGMQVIIEDYIHDELPKILLLALNTFFAIGVGVACVFAILKLSFGA